MNTSVISVVGAGGKTTLLHRLEDECVRKKQHVIITTTTKIMHENKPYFLEDTSIGKIKDTLGKFGRVWIGSRDLISGKTAPPAKEILDEIFWWELPILVEADGAKRLPLKVPAEHEPVIPTESAGVKHISGAGGQLDFVLGAYLSKGGKSFICLSSTFFNKKTGQLESRIRPTLENGSIITDTRANLHYLCTEYGCVNLKGLTTWEKAEALINVAHPDFREELIKEAEKMHIWRRSNKI